MSIRDAGAVESWSGVTGAGTPVGGSTSGSLGTPASDIRGRRLLITFLFGETTRPVISTSGVPGGEVQSRRTRARAGAQGGRSKQWARCRDGLRRTREGAAADPHRADCWQHVGRAREPRGRDGARAVRTG